MIDDASERPTADGEGRSEPRDETGTPRRDFFRSAAAAAGVIGVAGALAGKYASAPLVSTAAAQTAGGQGERWWPSRWGPEDEAGASNWITPQKVLEAARWIREGRVFRIGRVYETGMPMFGARAFSLRIPGGPTGGPFGKNKLIFNDEFLAAEVGQSGTQFDGLGHIGLQMGRDGDKNEMRYYNGFTEQQVGGAYGLQKLGVEKVRPFFTRGHLFDVEAVRGRMLDAAEEITVADLRAAMQRQGMNEADIRQGDAVFFQTGWSKLWMKNNDRYNGGEPGSAWRSRAGASTRACA
jgi:hypothetical protein